MVELLPRIHVPPLPRGPGLHGARHRLPGLRRIRARLAHGDLPAHGGLGSLRPGGRRRLPRPRGGRRPRPHGDLRRVLRRLHHADGALHGAGVLRGGRRPPLGDRLGARPPLVHEPHPQPPPRGRGGVPPVLPDLLRRGPRGTPSHRARDVRHERALLRRRAPRPAPHRTGEGELGDGGVPGGEPRFRGALVVDRRIPAHLRAVRACDRRRPRDVGERGGWLNTRTLLATALLVSACGAPGPGPWVEEDGYRWRELRPRGSGGFRPLDGSDLGVSFLYDVDEETRLRNRVRAEGQGVAIGDVDGDGLADLFFAGFGRASALYRNLGGWRFEEITPPALALEDVLARGATLVDVDGDDDLDLVIAVHGGRNRIFLGDGAGGFAELEDAGLAGAWGSTTATLADTDGDGDLDLYIANYKTRQVDDLYPPDVLDINHLQRGEDGNLVIPPELRELYDEHYRVEFDGRFVRRFELGEPDEYYAGLGDGRFAPAAPAAPLARSRGNVSAPARDWGLAARFSDWDEAGDPDLYVANDVNSEDGIWINRGDGTFAPAPSAAVRTTSLSSMAVDVGDLDRDGDLDLLTTDMLARDAAERLAQTPSYEAVPERPGLTDARIQVNRNAVQLNRGDGTFAEAAWELGLAASDWTWGALIMDADLDGWNDILVTTGHAWDQLDGDANARVAAIPGLPADQALRMFPPLAQPNVAFRGGEDGFTDVSESWRWGHEADISHGLAAGDLDRDGDLDVVVTRLGVPPLMYRNDAAASRILVRLRAPGPNTHGIGARIRLDRPDGLPAQVREITAGGAYLSSSEPVASFAATADGEMVIAVDWPDGRRTRLEGVVANREYVIDAATAEPAAPDPDGSATAATAEAGAHFVDISDWLAHRHVESPYDDRLRQPLLPHSLDRLGP
ncbi:MAG: hypothetical protein F4Z33_01160, partial [Gemmatimonadales bacterium]|nr:hypothetical protein [Gemmatimonadales bacterium]